MPQRFYLHSKTYSDGRHAIYLDARWGQGSARGEANESRLRTSTSQRCRPENGNEDK